MSDEFKVQITLNAPPPAQYAKGAMANFRGESVDDVYVLLSEARNDGLLELAAEVEAIWTAAAGLGAKTVSTEAAQPAATAPSEPAAVSNLRVCTHGKRTERTGTSAKGPWKGYFCPEKNKANQCPVEWAN